MIGHLSSVRNLTITEIGGDLIVPKFISRL